MPKRALPGTGAHHDLELRNADRVVEGQRILQLKMQAPAVAILIAREHLAREPHRHGGPFGQARHFERNGPAGLNGGKSRPVPDQGLRLKESQFDRVRPRRANAEHKRFFAGGRGGVFLSHGAPRQKKR